MKEELHYNWEDVGSMDVSIFGNDHAVIRYNPSEKVLAESLRTGAYRASKEKATISTNNVVKTDSEAFCAILRGVYENLHDEEYRNKAYMDFSREYNNALRDGDFEIAVICLMLMRAILIVEDSRENAEMISRIAIRIIDVVMTDSV